MVRSRPVRPAVDDAADRRRVIGFVGRVVRVKAGVWPRSYVRLNLALTLCLAPVLVTGCGSATPAANSAGSSPTAAAPTAAASALTSPSPAATSGQASPSASAGATTFASRLYAYSLEVPPGWQGQPAESAWTDGWEDRCPSDWDCFAHSSGEPTLAIAAESVAADLTLDQWRMRMQVGVPTGCIDSAQASATTLGGAPAQAWTTTCEDEGLHATKVVALHAGRGYVVLFVSPIDIGLESDRATLNSILTTFRFAPS
jgi:hypothetical protein